MHKKCPNFQIFSRIHPSFCEIFSRISVIFNSCSWIQRKGIQWDPKKNTAASIEKKQILKKHDKDIVRTAFKRRMYMDIHHA